MNVMENSILIQRPVADVFRYVSQYENDIHWRKGVTTMTQNTPVTQVGTQTHEVMTFMGSTYETDGSITEVAPNSKVVYKSTQGQVGVVAWRRVEAADGGARLTLHTEITMSGFMVLVAPVMAAVFSRQMRADLQTLRQILEK